MSYNHIVDESCLYYPEVEIIYSKADHKAECLVRSYKWKEITVSCMYVTEEQTLLVTSLRNGVGHHVIGSYQVESNVQTERQNEDLSELFPAAQLERDDLITAASEILSKVSARQNKSRGGSLLFSFYRFQLKLSFPTLSHPIPIHSDSAK